MNNPKDKSLLIKAEQGDSISQLQIGKTEANKGNYKTAIEWLNRSRALRNAEAALYLGRIMLKQKKRAEAFECFMHARELARSYVAVAPINHREIWFYLGVCYFEGIGTPRNVNEGLIYLTKAAKDCDSDETISFSGLTEAQLYLSRKYKDGDGVKLNLHEANKWLKKARPE